MFKLDFFSVNFQLLCTRVIECDLYETDSLKHPETYFLASYVVSVYKCCIMCTLKSVSFFLESRFHISQLNEDDSLYRQNILFP